MITVSTLLNSDDWKPIPQCPGRFVSTQGPSYQTPHQVTQTAGRTWEFPRLPPADTVVVMRLNGGGLISYRKVDGSYRHTLNTDEGFVRKLAALGLEIEPPQ